jgi:hypothetical protein
MSKADWKYNPLGSGGISVVTQEDTARDADYERRCAENRHNAVEGLATVFRMRCYPAIMRPDSATHMADVFMSLGRAFRNPMSADIDLLKTLDDYGAEAVVLALYRAYRSPELVVSDVVEHE